MVCDPVCHLESKSRLDVRYVRGAGLCTKASYGLVHRGAWCAFVSAASILFHSTDRGSQVQHSQLTGQLSSGRSRAALSYLAHKCLRHCLGHTAPAATHCTSSIRQVCLHAACTILSRLKVRQQVQLYASGSPKVLLNCSAGPAPSSPYPIAQLATQG